MKLEAVTHCYIFIFIRQKRQHSMLVLLLPFN